MSTGCPELYHNFAIFYHKDDEDRSVILVFRKSSIEVPVHRCNLVDELKGCQPSQETLCANASYEAFDESLLMQCADSWD